MDIRLIFHLVKFSEITLICSIWKLIN